MRERERETYHIAEFAKLIVPPMNDPTVTVILDDNLIDSVLLVLFPDFGADHIGSDSHKGLDDRKEAEGARE